MKKKFMFINAINPIKIVESRLQPLGLGYLVSSLREKFGQDHIKFKFIDQNIEQEIKKFKPDIIGITSVSQNYNMAIKYAKIAKKYKIPVVIGGVHISALPFTLTKNMNVGIIGEGEQTIVELFNLFERRGYFDVNELENIKGIVFQKDNKIIITKKRKPILPLDKLPMPARDLFIIKNSVYMFTSRGCPYRCSFCASSHFWGKIRFFSAEYVVNEIKYTIEKYNIKEIKFLDDLFIADRARLRKILKLLQKENILGKVSFNCNARSNLIDDELAYLLKQMNVKYVGMGLDSASPTNLEYLKGKNITVNNHRNSIKILRKYGLEFHASFIIGSPRETKKEILQTLKFIKENKLAHFDVYILIPLPGTPIWDYAKIRNLVSENMDWDDLNISFSRNYNKGIILSETLTRKELYSLYLLFRNHKLKVLIRNTLKHPLTIPKVLLNVVERILLDIPLTEV